MKKIILFVFILVLGFDLQAQDPKYFQYMGETFQTWKSAKTTEEKQELIGKFKRISALFTQEWKPNYYVALNEVLLSFMLKDSDQRDALLEDAQVYLDKAKELSKKNSEIITLQGFIYQATISVNPMLRGFLYGTKSEKALEKALKLDKNNPRAYYLMAMNLMHTPSFFGGSKTKALENFKIAREKFSTLEKKEAFSPNWGADKCEYFISKLSKAAEEE